MLAIDQFVLSIARPPSMKAAMRLISSAERTRWPGLETASTRPVRFAAVEARSTSPARWSASGSVVLREPFRQPELARNVRAIEVERLEPLRADAFDVPAVKELVRDGVENRVAAAGNRQVAGNDRAVAVLHAVAVGVRQVVGEERVVTRFVLGILAENRAFLLDDFLHVFHERVELVVRTRVVHREAEPAAVRSELAHRDRAELDGAVHEVLQVGRGQAAVGVQLRGDVQ
jgi:hypothetical protein